MSDKEIKKTPLLRFQAYKEAWEQCKLGDMLKTHQFKPYLANPKEEGEYEVIQQGDKSIIGYANGNPFRSYRGVTLFGDHTVSLYKPSKPFFVATDGVKILSSDRLEGRFLFTFLEKYKPEPQGYKRHFTILKNESAWITRSEEEQVKIGTFFEKIDNFITFQQREVELLELEKRTLLSKLFSKEGERVPEIRFVGFADAWEQRRFKDFTKLSQGLQIAISERYVEPDENRLFYITNEFLNPSSDRKYYIENPSESVIANLDDILMTRTGNTGKVLTGIKGAFHNNFFKIDYNSRQISKLFLYYLLTSEHIQKEILKRAGTSTIPDLNHSDFYNIEVSVPKYDEQKDIGRFFHALDNTITLHKRKLEVIKEMKKTLLKSMFV